MATRPIPNCTLKIDGSGKAQIGIPDAALDPDHFSAGSGDEFPASKLHHRHHKSTDFAFVVGGTPTTKEFPVYVARGAETITEFAAYLTADGSSTDIDFVLKKNGSTLMNSDFTFTDASGDGVVASGFSLLSSAALVAGDKLSILMTVNSATGATGPYAWVEIDSVGE